MGSSIHTQTEITLRVLGKMNGIRLRTALKIPFGLLTLLAAACAWAQRGGPSYSYVDPFTGGGAYTINVGDKALVEGDLKSPLTTCSTNEDFFCFRSRALTFAVPKDLRKSEWNFDGRLYKASPIKTYALLGRRFSGMQITTNESGVTITFTYSADDGLLAISFQDGSRSKHYLLAEQRGFDPNSMRCI